MTDNASALSDVPVGLSASSPSDDSVKVTSPPNMPFFSWLHENCEKEPNGPLGQTKNHESETMLWERIATMDFWEIAASLFVATLFLLPAGLVVWEVMWGHRKSVSTGRRRRLRFSLKTVFYGISAGGIFLAIWTSFLPPVATGLSVGIFVGGPLLFIVIGDLARKRRVSHRFLVERELTLDEAVVGERIDQGSASRASVADPSHADHQLIPMKDEERKWWARRWTGMRLGRFGIWH